MGHRLQAANNARTTLSGGISDSAVTLTLGSGSSFPTSNFRISVDAEIIEVGSRSGNTCSGLLRGREGTIAAAHSDGAQVQVRFTAGHYDELAAGADLTAHTGAAAPHSGHETPTGAQSKVDTHKNAATIDHPDNSVTAGKLADGAVDTLNRIASAARTTNGGTDANKLAVTDANGGVGKANAVPWSGVSSPPSTYAPSAHKTSHATGGTDVLTASDVGAASTAQLAVARRLALIQAVL